MRARRGKQQNNEMFTALSGAKTKRSVVHKTIEAVSNKKKNENIIYKKQNPVLEKN